jgi:Tautomerase enzyme
MPDVLVEVRDSWLGDRKSQFFDAINAAVVKALRSPPEEPALRLIEHAPETFVIPSAMGKNSAGSRSSCLSAAREKRALYKAIVEQLAPFGVPPEDVKVMLVQVPAENVGIHGGRAACDVDLGYEIKV